MNLLALYTRLRAMILTTLASYPVRPLFPSPPFASAASPERSYSLPLSPYFHSFLRLTLLVLSPVRAPQREYTCIIFRVGNESDPGAVFRHARCGKRFGSYSSPCGGITVRIILDAG
jgi:hypothetical protein